MKSMRNAAASVALALVMSLGWGGCAVSTLVNTWHDPEFHAAPLKNMMVIAVSKDASNRRIWEDEFSNELAKHDMAATPSYRLFPDAPPDTSQVISAVDSSDFDGILVILGMPSDTDTYHVKGYTTTEKINRTSLPPHQRERNVYRRYKYMHQDADDVSYWYRYRTYYREIYHPGYTDTRTTDIRAIDVTTTGENGELIWSATCRTPDPGSVADVQTGMARLVLTELVKYGIAAPMK